MMDIVSVYRNAIRIAAALSIAASGRAQCPSPCPSAVSLRNVELVVSHDGVIMRIPRLDGTIVLTTAERPSPFTPDAVVIRIDAAEVRFSSASLTVLMNGYVLVDGARVRNVTIKTDPGRREIIIDGPLQLRGPMVVTDELIHVQRNKRLLPGVDAFINWRRGAEHGVTAKNHDIILDPLKIIAPLLPIEGHLTGIAVDGDDVVETFGPARQSPSASEQGAIEIMGGDLNRPIARRLDNGWLQITIAR
jgi:hypothetical protein